MKKTLLVATLLTLAASAHAADLDTSPQAKKCVAEMASITTSIKEYAEVVSGYDLRSLSVEANGVSTAGLALTFVENDKITYSADVCNEPLANKEHAATAAIAASIAQREHADDRDPARMNFWTHQIDVARDVEPELEKLVQEEVATRCGK